MISDMRICYNEGLLRKYKSLLYCIDLLCFLAFINLLDNYESDTGVPETVTPQEEAENRRFLDLIFQTKPIELAYKFLKYRGKIDCTPPQFKHELYNLWFKLYRRTRATRYI